MCIIVFVVPTGVRSWLSLFWLYQNVSLCHYLIEIKQINCILILADRKHDKSTAFRTFRRHLFHSALSKIFSSIRDHMTNYKVMECPDGYKRRVIFGLGPYIADYPEQVLLSGVLSGWCGR